ncbi:hypothetical protein H7J88_20620 [Mycolicibacterium flavescens]|uniref:Uncharacterized protein n=1 Tax=Mycolicibacterium flavescens TaxID=1776 RepID=A0A1E3R942_MYCFV|nr:hypothetical protein [Mycolicibacterium flavescens]MCV7282037.1 hypothetical protein [Mycolicibacterium flavescens]ODQ86445.1 hypothetical protein BHQ18_26875 [Mycolicibacterium flavescens]
MAEREASGDFDYLFDDEGEQSGAALPAASGEVPEIGADYRSFDAFDSDTWYFEPAPPPWYRTRKTATLLAAISLAAIAIVVSGVLLVFDRPSGTAVDEVTTVSPTAQSSAPPPSSSRPEPPPPPPPPPPAETSAAPAPAPAQTNRPRTPSTRTTREQPEIGVTRTPVTRSPISVAPQRPDQR